MGCCVSQEPVDFTSPVDFKHFEILRAIGKGAFGKVCIVKKKDTKQMYAMKYMNKVQIIHKKAVENIFREIQIIKSLDHPFLVNLWYSFQDEEDIFVVLDLMLGGDISYHLEKEGRFPVNRVQLYTAECALAIDYLRSKMIIHRDIKPANMLLDSKGHVHLTDFNVACIVREGRPNLSMTGTRPYMAPEVIQPSRKGYSFAVDWWSLGVSVYEMLRGERPFSFTHHMSHEAMYNMLTTVRPPASARWDDATCSVLKMLLHPDAKKRLSSLEDAKTHKFFEGLNWEDVLKKDTSPAYVPSQNRIHCDPTHELEEMIVEPNPLHKKRSRLSKRRRDGMEEGLLSELNKISNRFVAYDRFRDSLAALESHEAEEKEKQTESGSHKTSPVTPKVELEPQFSAASLPKQNSIVSGENVQVAEAEVLAVVGTDISLETSASAPGNTMSTKTLSTTVEETRDELEELPSNQIKEHACGGPDSAGETVPAASEQAHAVVEVSGECHGKDGCDQHLSNANDEQSEVGILVVIENDSSGKEGESGGKEADSGGKEADSGGKEADSGGKEDRELLPSGPDQATAEDGTELGSKDVSSKDSDHLESSSKPKANALEEQPNNAANNGVECLKADMDVTESSSSRGEVSDTSPLIGRKQQQQQHPSDLWEGAPNAKQTTQVEGRQSQSNCNDSVDDDLRMES